MEAILVADPAARFVHADPVINIVTDPARPSDAGHAQGHRAAQFQAWDMLGGYSWPQIGGRADLAAALGVPIEGVCLYPVLDHPGWDDERYCPNGLLSWADDPAGRTAHDGLAAVIAEFGAARRAGGAVAGQPGTPERPAD